MKSFGLSGFSLVFVFLFFVSINYNNMAFGETGGSYQNESIELEGQFNILEIYFADGTYDMKYYLFVDNPLANYPTAYQLEFPTPSNALMDLVSENVIIKGTMSNSIASFSNSVDEVPILIESIEKTDPISSQTPGLPKIAQSGVIGTPVPSTIQSYTILSKFNGIASEPHDTTYFVNLFYNSTGTVYSLSNYFKDASYEKLNFTSAGISDWSQLGNTTAFYGDLSQNKIFNFTAQAIAKAELAGGPIDFNGADNLTQNMWNLTTGDFGNQIKTGVDNDDIDHLFLIYNAMSFGTQPNGCSCAFAWLGPVPITPAQGLRSVLISYLPDSTLFGNFSVDTSYRGGIGIPAHEFGHTLGWDHTHTFAPFTGPYNDPWSIMSKGSDTIAENNAGPIAYNRDHAKWIAPEDIITISNNQTVTFNLDKLSDPSPGSGYLMAKIPFGAGLPNEFYTLETRVNDVFDHTPENKKGLLMYHVRNAGHPGTTDLTAEAALVDVNGAVTVADWKDANLVLGKNFTQNNVFVSYLSDNGTSIVVQVKNNVSTPGPNPCTPTAGNWVVITSCTMTSSANVNGDVNVQNGAVVTIPSGITLTVSSGFSANVLSGGGILIASGGTLIIVS
jgi:M6 family metalloprotease-like protein